MSPALQHTINNLQTTGAVRLPGASATWSRLVRILFTVLLTMICALAIGSVTFFVIAAFTGAWPSGGALVGMLTSLIMLGGLFALVYFGRLRQKKYHSSEQQPVILEPQGLTMRGVGPIPWNDFGQADYEWVPAEHDTGFARRAVMPLTRSGLFNVNERLPPQLQKLISPPVGPVWDRRYEYIYVPGVEGLKQREVMYLINVAHHLHTNRLR